MNRKLKSCKGETLVEVLTSILVASLSVALLFGGIVASARIDSGAQQWDKEYYEALTAAEGHTEKVAAEDPAAPFQVEISDGFAGHTQKAEIDLYGKAGAWSYTGKVDGEGKLVVKTDGGASP